MAARHRDEPRLRTLLTQECARIMAEEGVKDFMLAKRKATARLGLTNRTLLPSNIEIEQALLAYQRLFKSAEQAFHLRTLRQAAVEAMRFLARFRPRLVGPVLTGAAGNQMEINLHLFADTAEEVVLFLLQHSIPFNAIERRLRFGNGAYAGFPAFSFGAGEVNIEVIVFARDAEREAPRSPVDGRPMRRANLAEVQALLAEAEASPAKPC